jgi:hypothetical protein
MIGCTNAGEGPAHAVTGQPIVCHLVLDDLYLSGTPDPNLHGTISVTIDENPTPPMSCAVDPITDSCDITFPAQPAGAYNFDPTYPGDGVTYAASFETGAYVFVTDGPVASTTTVSCPDSAAVHAPMRCAITVSVPDGASSPTGIVHAGASSCDISTNPCIVSITPTAAGPLTVTATYDGQAGIISSSGSSDVLITVRPTTVTIDCFSPGDDQDHRAFATQPYSCNVTPVDTLDEFNGFPNGPISVATGTDTQNCTPDFPSTFCSVTFTAGLTEGPLTVTASYLGNDEFGPSTARDEITIGPAPSTTTVTCPQFATINQTMNCAVHVSAPDGEPTPTGQVTVDPGAQSCDLDDTSSCIVAVPTGDKQNGFYPVTASYPGQAGIGAGTGSTTTIVNLRFANITEVSCATRGPVDNPMPAGQPINCLINVADQEQAHAIFPTGTISVLLNGDTETCTLVVDPDAETTGCAVDLPAQVAGSYAVTVTYSGSALHQGTGWTLPLIVA